MHNDAEQRFNINALIALVVIGIVIAGVVLYALSIDALLGLVAGVFAVGVILLGLADRGVNLFTRWTEAVNKKRQIDYEHDERMAKIGYLPNDDRYLPIASPARQIAAPAPEEKPIIDPRHTLLVNLCLLTIKSAAYGPTSKRLMTADDAQADRSGLFADRMKWDDASKYGQDCGYLYTQRGGNPNEQGLKVDCPSGHTAADLLVELHNKNLILDSAVNALPGVTR